MVGQAQTQTFAHKGKSLIKYLYFQLNLRFFQCLGEPFQKLTAVAASIALINTKSIIIDARISGITFAREHYKYLRPQKTLQVIQTLLVGSRHSQ